jgi:hypothetical protein
MSTQESKFVFRHLKGANAPKRISLALGTLLTLFALIAGVVGAVGAHDSPTPSVQPNPAIISLAPGGTMIIDKIAHPQSGFFGVVTHSIVTCDPNLSVSVTPSGYPITSPNQVAVFVETITLAPGATPGTSLNCSVAFFFGPQFEVRQRIFVTVLGAACEETTNPHGQTVPPAGNTTLPGPKGGQNEDGYYLISAVPADPNLQVFVVDTGSGTTFGPFASGTKIKYTQAPGATPSIKKIGSTNGEADAVPWHITGQGDAAVYAVSTSGTSPLVFCLVPPPPK